MQNKINVTNIGEPTIDSLTKNEQKTFYVSVLMQVLKLIGKQKEQISAELKGGEK